jgi:FkbM family methyltransferase
MKNNIIIPEDNLGYYTIPDNCNRNMCVDVGGNVGSFVLSQVNNFKTIHYYEPFEDCFNTIQEKTKGVNNIIGFKEAVYNKDNEIVSIVSHYNLDAGSNAIKTDSINEDWKDEVGTAKTISFPTILERANGHIDYLKVDCETSEYYFLIDQDLSSVDYIGIELHWQMGKTKYNQLLKHLAKTHITTGDCNWKYEINKEVLYIKK